MDGERIIPLKFLAIYGMRGRKLMVATVVVTSMLFFGATGLVVADHNTGVGSSGECDDNPSDTGVNNQDGVNEPEVENTINGFAGLAEDGQCSQDDTEGGYIEAHVSVEGAGHVQVCVDDDEEPTLVSAGQGEEACPTDPGE